MATIRRIRDLIYGAKPNHLDNAQIHDDTIVMPVVWHSDFYLNDAMAARQKREIYGTNN